MAKTSLLPVLAPASIDGSELVVAVKAGVSYRSSFSTLLAPIIARAEAAAALVGDAATVIAARDASALNKADAETANSQLQLLAPTLFMQAAQVAADRQATQAAAQVALGVVADIQPIAQNAILTADGQGVILGTATQSYQGVSIGFHAGKNTDPSLSAKSTHISIYAGDDVRTYGGTMIGGFVAQRATTNYIAVIGTHSAQYLNEYGSTFYGFGTQAAGTLTFTGQPTAGDTVTLSGVSFAYVSGAPATAYEIALGASVAETVANTLAAVVMAPDAALAYVHFRQDGSVLRVLSKSRGPRGNSFTLAVSAPAIAISAGTLTGGAYTVGTGDPGTFAGLTTLGWETAYGANPYAPSVPGGRLDFVANPAAGDTMLIGTGAGLRYTFVASAPGANQILIGATKAQTILNAAAVLNAASSTLVSPAKFWPDANGLQVIYNTMVGVSTGYALGSPSAAITATRAVLTPGSANLGNAQIAVGFKSLGSSRASNSIGIGNTTAVGSVGVTLKFMGSGGGASYYGQNAIGIGDNAFRFTHGSFNIALGDNISPTLTLEDYKQIVSVSADGIIKFVKPHGWDQGFSGAFAQRNLTTPTNLIKEDGSNLSTAAGGIVAEVISADEIRIKLKNQQDHVFVYSTSGPASQIDIAVSRSFLDHSITIGHNATPASRTTVIGTNDQYQTTIPGGRLVVVRGGIALPLIISGVQAAGSILFSTAGGDFADGDTVTLNGAVFTAKTTANLATANSTNLRWFEIGGTIGKSLKNLLACNRDSDDQSALARGVNRARFWVVGQSGAGWLLRCQIDKDTDGNSYTLATSKAGAIVTAPTGQTLGNLPAPGAPSVNFPLGPQNGDTVYVTASPRQNGNPGLARFNATRGCWEFL